MIKQNDVLIYKPFISPLTLTMTPALSERQSKIFNEIYVARDEMLCHDNAY